MYSNFSIFKYCYMTIDAILFNLCIQEAINISLYTISTVLVFEFSHTNTKHLKLAEQLVTSDNQ